MQLASFRFNLGGLGLWLWFVGAGIADETPVVGQLANVTQAMTEFVDQSEVAGIVTLVASDTAVTHCSAVGYSDLAAKKPMDTNAIFWIASMSKPVTATAVMILVDEGKVSLDDPITKFLPEMAGLRTQQGAPVVINIRHLLTHTSGMSELKPEEAYTSKNLTEAASRYAKLPVMFEPGSKWQYSQTSINTAARIVEVASGMNFDTFLNKRVFQPLKMRDTTFYLSESQLGRLAKSYKKLEPTSAESSSKQNATGALEETEIRLLSGMSPTSRDRFPAGNGGLFSTASDYGRFAQMLLRQGELDGVRVLSSAAVTTMRTVATGDLVTGFTPGNGWGIGCCVVREPIGITGTLSPGSFGHGGAYGTQAWIDPVKKRIYVLMIQRSNIKNSDVSSIRQSFQEQASLAP